MNKLFGESEESIEFITKNMMGPNSITILKELMQDTPLNYNMRVLDLGCGNGLTSICLAKMYGVQVFAVDLWISPSDNYKRFKQWGLEQKIIPLQCDAMNLPFSDAYFDAVISVDAYHYFGNNYTYFPDKIKPLLKDGAQVALAFPGMKYELHDSVPEEMKIFWDEGALEMWHSMGWWNDRLEKHIKNLEISEMKCFDKAWSDWLSCNNPYAIEDREMIAADNGRYMNLISARGTV